MSKGLSVVCRKQMDPVELTSGIDLVAIKCTSRSVATSTTRAG
jgi:hypothetical protein